MTSPQLEKMLIVDEGLRLKLYKCPAGYWTIGVGHNLEADGLSEEQIKALYSQGITEKHAKSILSEDVNKAIKGAILIIGANVWSRLSVPRQHAIINLVFNLGIGGFAKFKQTIQAIKRGDWEDVEKRLRASLWAKQVKKRADRVIKLLCREVYDPVYV